MLPVMATWMEAEPQALDREGTGPSSVPRWVSAGEQRTGEDGGEGKQGAACGILSLRRVAWGSAGLPGFL